MTVVSARPSRQGTAEDHVPHRGIRLRDGMDQRIERRAASA